MEKSFEIVPFFGLFPYRPCSADDVAEESEDSENGTERYHYIVCKRTLLLLELNMERENVLTLESGTIYGLGLA